MFRTCVDDNFLLMWIADTAKELVELKRGTPEYESAFTEWKNLLGEAMRRAKPQVS
jgi:hypothetical protein